MKIRFIITILFLMANYFIYGQNELYNPTLNPTNDLYQFHESNLKRMDLKGNVKYILQFSFENENFHSESNILKLNRSSGDFCEYYLDSNKQINQIVYRGINNLVYSKNYYQDKKINKITSSLANDSVYYIEQFNYNQDNLLINSIKKNKYDSLISTELFKYDTKNSLTDLIVSKSKHQKKYLYINKNEFTEVFYDKDTNSISIYYVAKYFLDSISKSSRHILFNNRNKHSFDSISYLDTINTYIYKFNNNWDLLFYKVSNDELTHISEYKYLPTNTLYQRIDKDSTTKYNFKTIYNYNNNKLIETSYYDSGNKIFKKELFTYNSLGDCTFKKLTTEFSSTEITSFKYIYDKNNNWIEKKEYINSKLFSVIKRVINYY